MSGKKKNTTTNKAASEAAPSKRTRKAKEEPKEEPQEEPEEVSSDNVAETSDEAAKTSDSEAKPSAKKARKPRKAKEPKETKEAKPSNKTKAPAKGKKAKEEAEVSEEKPKAEAKAEAKTEAKSTKKPRKAKEEAPAEEEAPKAKRGKKANKEDKAEEEAPAKAEPKASKPKKEDKKPKSRRPIKIKEESVLKSGLRISKTKIKKIITDQVIDTDAAMAIAEIESFEPINTEKNKREARPLSELSAPTKAILEKARKTHLQSQRYKFATKKISAMEENMREKYDKAFVEASSKEKESNPDFDKCIFMEKFNQKYDSHFYDDFKPKVPKKKVQTEYNEATSLISKLKIRYSYKARLYIAAAIEHFSCKMIERAFRDAQERKCKMIKLDNVVDAYADNIRKALSSDFVFYPILTSFEAFRVALKESEEAKAKASLKEKAPKSKPKRGDKKEEAKEEAKDETKEETKEEAKEETKDEPKDEEDAKKNQFKCYVSELCLKVRSLLLDSKDVTPEQAEAFSSMSISSRFKEFCADVITELAVRFGNLIRNEIKSMNVKTINIVIAVSVVKHMHAVLNLPVESTQAAIDAIILQYEGYIQKRKAEKKAADPEGKVQKGKGQKASA